MYKRKQPISAPVAPDENQSTAETSKTFGNQAVEDNNTAKQETIQYLNDIINGKIDGMADGVLDKMIELEERVS